MVRNNAWCCNFDNCNVSYETSFKTDAKKILGLNPHVIIQPNSFKIKDEFIIKLKENFKRRSALANPIRYYN